MFCQLIFYDPQQYMDLILYADNNSNIEPVTNSSTLLHMNRLGTDLSIAWQMFL